MNSPQVTRYFRFFCLIANLLVIVTFFFWWISMWQLRNPSPYADDFDSCLTFLSDFAQSGKWKLLFGVHNESSQLILRSLVLLNYSLTKTISFSFLTAWSISVPIVFLFLLGFYLKDKLKISWFRVSIWLLPSVFLVLQPGAWGSYLWVTSGLTHGVIPVLVLASIFAFEREYYFLSALVSLLAFFSGGAGMFAPLILLAFFVSPKVSKHKIFIAALLIMSAIGIWYIIYNPLLLQNFREFFSKDESFVGMIFYTLAFVGNAAHFQSVNLSISTGILALVLILSTRSVSAPALLGVIIIAICAGVASAILRYPGGGIAHALLSRYEVYATTLWAALYSLFLIRFPQKRKSLWLAAMIIAGSIAVINYSSVPRAIITHHQVQNRDFVLARFDPTLVLAEYPPRVATDNILDRAKAVGIFDSDPTSFFEPYIERDVSIPEESAPLLYNIELEGEDSSFLALQGWSLIRAREIVVPEKICLLIASTTNLSQNFRLCLPKQTRNDIISQLSKEDISDLPKNFGFSLVFPKKVLPEGSYRAGLIVAGRRNWHLTWLRNL